MRATAQADAAQRAAEWDHLAAALNTYGVIHVAPTLPPEGDLPSRPTDLFLALNHSPDVRLQEAAVLLLLTHPGLAAADVAAVSSLHGVQRDRAQRRYVAAAALQRMWRSRIQLALGPQEEIPSAYVKEMDLPSLDEDFGRRTLMELSAQEERLYGYDAWAGYASLMDLFLAEMERKGWGQLTPAAAPHVTNARPR